MDNLNLRGLDSIVDKAITKSCHLCSTGSNLGQDMWQSCGHPFKVSGNSQVLLFPPSCITTECQHTPFKNVYLRFMSILCN